MNALKEKRIDCGKVEERERESNQAETRPAYRFSGRHTHSSSITLLYFVSAATSAAAPESPMLFEPRLRQAGGTGTKVSQQAAVKQKKTEGEGL